jgi:negative regulator of genetic competence, sporulation and motility
MTEPKKQPKHHTNTSIEENNLRLINESKKIQEVRQIISQIESRLSEHSDLEIYYLHGCYFVLVEDPTQTYKRRTIFESYVEERILNFLETRPRPTALVN